MDKNKIRVDHNMKWSRFISVQDVELSCFTRETTYPGKEKVYLNCTRNFLKKIRYHVSSNIYHSQNSTFVNDTTPKVKNKAKDTKEFLKIHSWIYKDQAFYCRRRNVTAKMPTICYFQSRPLPQLYLPSLSGVTIARQLSSRL